MPRLQNITNKTEDVVTYTSAPQQRTRSEQPPSDADAPCFTVTLTGGTPWGFRLQGGEEFDEPIRIAKVGFCHVLCSSFGSWIHRS